MKMIEIEQVSDGLYIVNEKVVDTRLPSWGKNLTASEYKELQNFRKIQDNEKTY